VKSSGWSLRQRATRQFALTVSLFLAAVAILVMVGYRVVLENELDEELIEQIEELEARYRAGPGGAAEFARLAAPTQEDAETPMAWRAVAQDGTVWGPHGARELVAALDQAPSERGSRRIDGHLRVARGELAHGLVVDLALDGRSWMERFSGFALICGAIVVAGAATSWLAGRAFAARIAAQLERVAAEVANRGARRGTEAIEIAGAPNEVRGVAEAIESTLRATEAETERAQLLLAGVAHDLRAPVQSMLTSTQVACLSQQLPEAAQELLETHQNELRRLARTIDNLVAWSSPQRPDGAELSVEFDLARELEGRLLAEETEAARSGVLIDVQREGDLRLHGDPGLILLAVRNLVSNAVGWSPTGGEVLVSLRGTAEQIELRVDDEGPGVPAGERERIFQPLVRGAAAPGRRAGYGLGLAIVARAVLRHGGRVHVESSATGGASFVLRLPRRSDRTTSPLYIDTAYSSPPIG